MLGMAPDTPVQSPFPSEETEAQTALLGKRMLRCVRAEGWLKRPVPWAAFYFDVWGDVSTFITSGCTIELGLA